MVIAFQHLTKCYTLITSYLNSKAIVKIHNVKFNNKMLKIIIHIPNKMVKKDWITNFEHIFEKLTSKMMT